MPRVMEPGWEVWEEEDAEAHFKDHNGETPVGNISLPGGYLPLAACNLYLLYTQGID